MSVQNFIPEGKRLIDSNLYQFAKDLRTVYYTRDEVDEKLESFVKYEIEVLDHDPKIEEMVPNKVYIVHNLDSKKYTEWILLNGKVEKINESSFDIQTYIHQILSSLEKEAKNIIMSSIIKTDFITEEVYKQIEDRVKTEFNYDYLSKYEEIKKTFATKEELVHDYFTKLAIAEIYVKKIDIKDILDAFKEEIENVKKDVADFKKETNAEINAEKQRLDSFKKNVADTYLTIEEAGNTYISRRKLNDILSTELQSYMTCGAGGGHGGSEESLDIDDLSFLTQKDVDKIFDEEYNSTSSDNPSVEVTLTPSGSGKFITEDALQAMLDNAQYVSKNDLVNILKESINQQHFVTLNEVNAILDTWNKQHPQTQIKHLTQEEVNEIFNQKIK